MSDSRPTLFCFDGSDSSQRALHAVTGLLASTEAVVLTIWQPLTARLAETGGFGVFALDAEPEVDADELKAAQAAAETAVAAAAQAGITATARVEEADGPIWQKIIEVADELDAGLIVCGTRGRGPVKTALLGSVSHAVLAHAGRPVLISPEPRADA